MKQVIEKAIDYFSNENYDKLTDSELEKLKERLNAIEKDQLIAWGLHRISGGFVKAEFDYVEGDVIGICIIDGIQSDCDNRVNETFCELYRNNLEYKN